MCSRCTRMSEFVTLGELENWRTGELGELGDLGDLGDLGELGDPGDLGELDWVTLGSALRSDFQCKLNTPVSRPRVPKRETASEAN